MKEFLYILCIIIVALIIVAIDFLWTAGIVKILSWAFDFTFSWKISIGVWIFTIVFKLFLRGVFAKNKEIEINFK